MAPELPKEIQESMDQMAADASKMMAELLEIPVEQIVRNFQQVRLDNNPTMSPEEVYEEGKRISNLIEGGNP
jgi:hypothetical protein